MSIDAPFDNDRPTSDIRYWQELVRDHPKAGNTVQYDADAAFEEYSQHNTILQMVVMNMYSMSNQLMEDVVSLLLKDGADPNIQNDKGETALHLVCQHPMRDPPIARLLLTHGANRNIHTTDGKLPIDFLANDDDPFSRELRVLLQ